MSTNNDAEKIAREIANEICNHTFIDPALPTWKKHIIKRIAPLVQERDELKATLRVGTALENCNLLKDNAELRAQLEKAKEALNGLVDFASGEVRGWMRPTLGPINGPGVIYVGLEPDDFEAIRRAKATLAELSAKDSTTEPPSGQATKIPEPPPA